MIAIVIIVRHCALIEAKNKVVKKIGAKQYFKSIKKIHVPRNFPELNY